MAEDEAVDGGGIWGIKFERSSSYSALRLVFTLHSLTVILNLFAKYTPKTFESSDFVSFNNFYYFKKINNNKKGIWGRA